MYRPVWQGPSTASPVVVVHSADRIEFDSLVTKYHQDWGAKNLNDGWNGIVNRGRKAADGGQRKTLTSIKNELHRFVRNRVNESARSQV